MENENIKDTSIKDNHQYGLDYIEDLKRLYGEDYEEVNEKLNEVRCELNEMRHKLFESLNDAPFEVQYLRTIIQNPVPISKKDIEEFDRIYKELKEKYDLRKSTIKAINNIRKFAIKYHLKDK